MKKSVKRKIFWPYGLALFTLLLAIDQYTKNIIVANFSLGESRQAFPGLWFTYLQNTGAIWSSFTDMNGVFIWLSIIAFGLLIFFYEQFDTTIEKICYTLIMVGLWGNLIDRGTLGFVVDFIDVHWWPVFNIADSCISIAIVLYLLEQWRKSRVKT
jgi:signal peptidase II